MVHARHGLWLGLDLRVLQRRGHRHGAKAAVAAVVMAMEWLLIIACGVLEVFIFGVVPKWILAPLNINATFIRVFTVLRALRLARLARAVRMRPNFKVSWPCLPSVLALKGSQPP